MVWTCQKIAGRRLTSQTILVCCCRFCCWDLAIVCPPSVNFGAKLYIMRVYSVGEPSQSLVRLCRQRARWPTFAMQRTGCGCGKLWGSICINHVWWSICYFPLTKSGRGTAVVANACRGSSSCGCETKVRPSWDKALPSTGDSFGFGQTRHRRLA